jgi:tRNA-dihydrouridine synthase
MSNFWKELNKPFTVLAPMDDVTDVVFRNVLLKTARPDVFFTEFTNCDALVDQNEKKRENAKNRLLFSPQEHPVIAQLWGSRPETFLKAAMIVKNSGFDGVDINMGCPQKDVVKTGGGSALINNFSLVSEIISAVKEGAGDLPVSVKTRIGTNKIVTEDWVGFLLDQRLSALTIHGRTAKEQSLVDAHWEEIGKAVELRNASGSDTVIIGNGDIEDFSAVQKVHDRYGVDGAMIGRGIFKNLWAFEGSAIKKEYSEIDHLELLNEHILDFNSTWGSKKNFSIMKKFFKAYIKDFSGASELRKELFNVNSAAESTVIIEKAIKERTGIDRNPKSSKYLSEQDTPNAHVL